MFASAKQKPRLSPPTNPSKNIVNCFQKYYSKIGHPRPLLSQYFIMDIIYYFMIVVSRAAFMLIDYSAEDVHPSISTSTK